MLVPPTPALSLYEISSNPLNATGKGRKRESPIYTPYLHTHTQPLHSTQIRQKPCGAKTTLDILALAATHEMEGAPSQA